MQIRLLVALVLIMLLFAAMRWFARTPPAQIRQTLKRTLFVLVLALLVFLAASGRLHWLVAVLASLLPLLRRALPLLRYVPLLNQLYRRYRNTAGGANAASGGRSSRVETHWLCMSLDHDSGAIDGEVLSGEFRGQRLTELSLPQLLALYHTLQQQDQNSARLLQGFLDRVHGASWRGHADGTTQTQAPPVDTSLSRQEALAILGLEEGADREHILAAHRRLIQRLHPDRGGSDYLAARLNEARDVLLGL